MDDYKDIINMPYKKSDKHRMSMYARAAQFAPFAAVTGHEDAIEETARITESFREPDENILERINEALLIIDSKIGEKPKVKVRYYLPDQKKSGGTYCEKTGRVVKNDQFLQRICFEDKTVIEYDKLTEIDIL